MSNSALLNKQYSMLSIQPQGEGGSVVDGQRYPTDFEPFATSTIHSTGRCAKTFGTTNGSGNSTVIQGDIYVASGVLQFGCERSRPDQPAHILQTPRSSIESFSCVTRTTNGLRSQWHLMPCVSLTQKTITGANRNCRESSWVVAITILQLCILTVGLAYRPSSLTFFTPRLQNIVPDDAPFMLACRRGDIVTMRYLISTGKALYTDITKDNLTPLYLVLESGVTTAIKEVLNNITDVDATFGVNQTTALAWALYLRNAVAVRLILAKDADLQHISLFGWTPVFYLWRHEEDLQESSLELLQILQTSDPKGFRQSASGIIDTGGLDLLHRVASLGTPDEVQWLLDCGVDTSLRTGRLEWTAMFNAVYDGRLDNLRVLTRGDPRSVINDRDLRGWSLLHLAAAEGHVDILEWLLESGADPYVQSQPSFVDVPEALFGLECTPAEVARAEDIIKEQAYWVVVSKIYGDKLVPRE